MAPHSSTPAWKENLMDGGAWKAAVHGVAEGRTWLSYFTFTFHFHALEKEMATHSSVLVWRIPGTGEAGGLLSLGLHRVRHDWSDLADVCVRMCVCKRVVKDLSEEELECDARWSPASCVGWARALTSGQGIIFGASLCCVQDLLLSYCPGGVALGWGPSAWVFIAVHRVSLWHIVFFLIVYMISKGKIPWRRGWQPTPVFMPEESLG